ncbi:MAG: helix-turn-helix transcriptional regulator [Pseudomonadota bacterium]
MERRTDRTQIPAESSEWNRVDALAHELVAAGARAGLPYVAAQADLGDAAPMADRSGRPYASMFPWLENGRDYWRNRRLALESTFLHAARLLAEPIWFGAGRLHTWRPTHILDPIDCARVQEQFGITGALIAPVHLPAGQVGAVVWATTDTIDMAAVFERHAEPMFALAVRFLAAHTELVDARHRVTPAQLTRREAQCVRWAAAGKTTAEIGIILSLSISTVRFHLRNAGEKFGASTRARLIQMATGHGFLGPEA